MFQETSKRRKVSIFRKFLLISLSVLSIFVFCSCNFDPYYGKRPYDYGASTWVCENPSARFVVNPEDEDYDTPQGEIQLNDDDIPFKLIFVTQTDQVFFVISKRGVSYDEGYNDGGFEGDCVFSPEKFVIKVDKDTDTLFNGQYDELVFLRISSDKE